MFLVLLFILVWVFVIFRHQKSLNQPTRKQDISPEESLQSVRERDLARFDQIIAQNPEGVSPWLWLQRGDWLRKLNRPKEAFANYEEALKYYPGHPQLLHEQGFLLATFENFEEALEYYQKSTESKPNNPENLHAQGDALLELGRYEDAIACLRKVLKVSPYNAYHYWGDIGYGLFQLGRYKEAQQALRKSLELQSSAQSYYWYAQTFIHLNQPESALKIYEKATPQFPNVDFLCKERVHLLWQYSTEEAALDECNRFLHHQSDNFSILYLKALLLFRQERWGLASKVFFSLKASDLSVQPLAFRVLLLMKEKRYDQVLADCTVILEKQPNHQSALDYSAQAFEYLGQDLEALERYQTLLHHYPDAYWARVRCGLILRNLQRHAEALQSFEIVLRQHPEDIEVLYFKAITLLSLNRQQEALEAGKRVLELDPNHQGAIAHLFAKNQVEDSAVLTSQSIEILPTLQLKSVHGEQDKPDHP